MTFAIAGATTLILVTSSPASAFWPFSSNNEEGSTLPPMIQTIMDRFGLNQNEVQGVMDEVREEHHSQMEQRFEDNLSLAIENGTLTQEQKQLMEAKHEETEAAHVELRGLSGPEKRDQMQATHQEMSDWAEANGIDMSELMPMQGRYNKGMGGMHGSFGRGMHR